jgi:DNA polymerase III delta subunit
MEVGAVKKQIKAKTLDNFYIFTGEEVEVQRIYVHKMAEVSNRDVQYIDNVSHVYGRKSSLFSKAKCYVCRDDMDFIKTESTWDDIVEALGDNMLILLVSEIDKRIKFYKRFSDKIVEFKHMNQDTLKKYILKQINLSEYWLDKLIDVCESDYSRILLEIDKIKQFVTADLPWGYNTDVKCDKALSQLLEQGAIHTPPYDAIFDFVDAVLMNQPQKAFELLEDCKKIGEPSLRLTTVLYSNAKKVLQVQACESKDISKATGLSAWDIKCTQNKLHAWGNGDLVHMMKLLRDVEKRIKTGGIDEEDVIDYVMVNIF